MLAEPSPSLLSSPMAPSEKIPVPTSEAVPTGTTAGSSEMLATSGSGWLYDMCSLACRPADADMPGKQHLVGINSVDAAQRRQQPQHFFFVLLQEHK